MKIRKTILLLLFVLPFLGACATGGKTMDSGDKGKEQVWKGTLTIQGTVLELVLKLDMVEDISGVLDIPTQRAYNLPLIDFAFDGNNLSFTLPSKPYAARFEGAVSGNIFEGQFSQAGITGGFRMELQDKPEAEGPTEGEELSITVSGGKLYGTLLIPEKKTDTVVLIIAGSGPTDRDGNSPLLAGKNDSLKMIAELLRDNNSASLRFDKRGVGKSAGSLLSEEDLTFEDMIDDAVSWIRYLRNERGFKKVIVLGHSEGSLIGMAAAEKTKAEGFISLAGMGRGADLILKEQLAQTPEPDRTRMYSMIDTLKAGNRIEDVPEEYYSLFRPSVQPYMISFLSYNPAEIISRLNIPVLIVGGTTDIQVPVEDARILAKANPGAKLSIIEGMNHILKIAPADREKNLAAYSDPTLPLAEELQRELAAFINN